MRAVVDYPNDEAARAWREARSFAELCELGARFLEGELPFFPGKTYAGYKDLPPMRVNYDMYRFPKHMKQGEELMNWQESVLGVIGADGERGVQPFKE